MEKLERILHAEDAARTSAEAARAAAAATLGEARAKATEVLRTGREAIRADASTHRDRVIAQARADAASLTDAAGTEAGTVIADAEGRADAALDAVLRAVRGL